MNRHAFLFDESRAIVNMLNYFPRIIQESPEIQKNSTNFNGESSFNLYNVGICVGSIL